MDSVDSIKTVYRNSSDNTIITYNKNDTTNDTTNDMNTITNALLREHEIRKETVFKFYAFFIFLLIIVTILTIIVVLFYR